jgi:hypothetical protein
MTEAGPDPGHLRSRRVPTIVDGYLSRHPFIFQEKHFSAVLDYDAIRAGSTGITGPVGEFGFALGPLPTDRCYSDEAVHVAAMRQAKWTNAPMLFTNLY